ncbi:hypothetical protein Cch01nite_23680 [Cellulomonas chitinilytica]|uniref:DUF3017 domain-containing protein n=1 Tax=Cellulomonas chitinilytica TaxID=398759 RepID=A0A919P611_9CELL|nr:hypothetical protein [Cellulomonas chitinilytica]GIG21644.1 hypothetical protein Cch01nite_23680 [Cellulomonas chitinilytica]
MSHDDLTRPGTDPLPGAPAPFTTPRPASWVTVRVRGAVLVLGLLAVTELVVAVTSGGPRSVASAAAFAVAGVCAWPSSDAPAVPGGRGRRVGFGVVRAVAAVVLCFGGVLLAIPA